MNYCQFRNDFIKRMTVTSGGATPILPDEYQQVEYIQTGGSQYINTGRAVQSNNISIYAKIQKTSSKTGEMDLVSNQDEATNRFALGSYNGNWFLYNRTAQSTYSNATLSADMNVTEILAEFNNYQKRLTRNGISTSWMAAGAVTNGVGLMLFRSPSRIATDPFYFVGKIYLFEYKEDDTTVFKLYPCYRKSDNKPGMYDLITDTFFTNAGSGDFTVGNNV